MRDRRLRVGTRSAGMPQDHGLPGANRHEDISQDCYVGSATIDINFDRAISRPDDPANYDSNRGPTNEK